MIGKILIVEDEDYKESDLRECLQVLLPGYPIESVDTFRGARKLLSINRYFLCMLDMTLPTFSKSEWTGAPESSSMAGRRLINFIEKTGVVDHVVLFTQYSTFSEYTEEVSYEDMAQIMEKECPKVFSGSIQYVVGDIGWKEELDKIITKIKNESASD